MTLGQQISEARKAKNIRQNVIAQELGVTVQAVSQWERDKTIPSQLNLMRLSALLDIKIDGLEVIKHIPMLARPATYAPLISAFPTLFYGPAGQAEYLRPEGEVDFVDFDYGKSEMVPITWDAQGNVFAMKIEDTSMMPTFKPGDLIIVDSGIKPSPGDFVIGQHFPSGAGLLRKYRAKGVDDEKRQVVDLVPLNEDYSTETITLGKTGEITGCVKEIRRIIKEK